MAEDRRPLMSWGSPSATARWLAPWPEHLEGLAILLILLITQANNQFFAPAYSPKPHLPKEKQGRHKTKLRYSNTGIISVLFKVFGAERTTIMLEPITSCSLASNYFIFSACIAVYFPRGHHTYY